jgi:AmmeMemoRadiSam system protein B
MSISIKKGGTMSERKLAVSGQFYPNDKQELNRYIDHFDKVLDENNITIDTTFDTRAIIVPHAGYIYSGFTANIAYKYIPKSVENIIVIGPSHKFAFDGASVALYDSYPTPFGSLSINKELSQNLIEKYDFLDFYDEVHSEHSTETQFPFIKYYQSEKKVVEIVYSRCQYEKIAQIIKYLLEDKKNFIIISTDLSHFYSIDEAKKKDSQCLEAIAQNDIGKFTSECEACGIIGVKALIKVTSQLQYRTKLLDYRTSADISGDTKSVVGYTSFLVYS